MLSFLNNCNIVTYFSKKINDQESVKIGAVQGFLVTPIFFMLFAIPLFKLFQEVNKIISRTIQDYIDDGLFTVNAISKDASIEII